jgi:predicted dienelactone hydrolase
MSKRLFLVIVIGALVLTALSANVVAQEGEGPTRTGLRPDAPPYAIRGPYPVGVTGHVIEDGNERSLNAHIWYPALNSNGVEEQIEYSLPYWGDLTVTGHALEDAAPNFENGPYPLVIFAHGLSGQRLSSAYLCEHLASHGFVVISIDYQDNQGVPGQPMYPSHISRPTDVSRQIDYAEALTANGGVWAGLIDIEHVGVTGHSFGGYTALAAAGAQLDWDHLAEVCETYPDPLGTCPAILTRLEDMAALAGWDEVPASPWPNRGDERVDAIAPLAPAGRFYGPKGVRDITVPVMLLGGTHDMIAIAEYNFYPVYDALNAPKTQVLFENADHMIFFLDCADAPWLVAGGFFWACSDAVWGMARAHDLTDHFVTAFFLAELYGDQDAAEALSPDAVSFPGITYETTGY